MNIPRDAVRNKMKLENIDIEIIEIVLGKEVKQDKQESTSVAESKPLSSEDQETMSKYKKMMKIGLPPDAVRHAMLKESVKASIITALFGPNSETGDIKKQSISFSEEEKKQIDQYKKMMKLGLPKDAVRHKMTMENASKKVMNAVLNNEGKTSTSSPSQSCNKRKTSGLMNIHWEKLSKEKVENQQSIWSRSAKKPRLDTKNVDLATLEQLFLKKPVVKATRTRATNDSDNGSKMAKILDINRAQNVSISLQAFKQFPLDELVAIIKDLDPENQIKGDRVLFLSGLLPNKEEEYAIRQYKGEDSRLVSAELFFHKLQSVQRVPSKIKVMGTMEMFKQNVEEMTSKFNILTETCNDVIKSEKLQLVLESVLTIGNIMNEGTSSGGAVGIKFESLLKLTQTKSKNGKMSVLDYIVMMFIEKNDRDALNLSVDFPQCSTASRILITDIVSEFTSLESSLKVCKTELSKMKTEQINSGSEVSAGLRRLEHFMSESDSVLSMLKKQRTKGTQACKDLAEYCGEDGGERAATTILGILTEFTISIDSAVVKHDKLKEQEAKKEARKKKAESATPTTGASKESIDTPRRTLFKTPCGNKKIDVATSSNENPKSALLNAIKNIGNHSTGQSKQSPSKSNPKDVIAINCNDESTLQSIMNKKANNTMTASNDRSALLQLITSRTSNTGGKRNTDAITAGNDRNVLLQSITSQKTNSEINNDAMTEGNGRNALLQSITSRKSNAGEEKEKNNDTVTAGNDRNALLQSITNRKSTTGEEKNIDTMTAGNDRNALLQSITSQKANSEEESQAPNTRDEFLQSIVRQNTSINRNDGGNPGDDKEETIDPRKAFLQSIVKQRHEKETIPEMDDIFSINSSSTLLQNILKRKAEETCSNDENEDAKSSQPAKENELLKPPRAVIRSSRSLGSGIVPDWDLAVTTFNPS